MTPQEQDRLPMLMMASIADSLYRIAHQHGSETTDYSEELRKAIIFLIMNGEETEKEEDR